METETHTQGNFQVFRRPGPENLGYYHSKHHSPEPHIYVPSKYLHVPNLRSLQGCVNLTLKLIPPNKRARECNYNITS